MKVRGGEAVVRSLVEHKVKTVYGLPGSHVLDIYNSLRDEKRINNILVMHELNAAFMADAHGRLTGKPGVCIVTGGPGATNAVTGIAQAYTEASPVVLIAGGSSTLKKIQPDHSVDDPDFQLKIYQPLTKWCTRIERVEDIPATLNKAFAIATSNRPGPVYLEIPKDVLTSSGDVSEPEVSAKAEPADISSSVMEVADILESSTRPLIAVGRGVLREFCSDEVERLAGSLCSPIVTLPSAIGAVPFECPFYVGYDLAKYTRKYAAWHVHPLINSLIQKVDVILTLGFDIGERVLCFKGKKNGTLIHIHHDTSPMEYNKKNVPDAKSIVDMETGIRTFVQSLERQIRRTDAETETLKKQVSEIKRKIREDIAKSIKWGNKPIHPGEISTELSRILDDDAIVTLDVGNNASWMKLCHRANTANTILAPGRYSSMGFALPAAIAAKINFPKRQVVAVTGDGGFLMSYMDFPTLVKYNLDIVLVVENNRRYGMIWHMQRTEYRRRTVATEIETPDFAEYARTFGATGMKIRDPKELRKALEDAINVKGPVLVDIDTAYKFPTYLPTKIGRLGRKIKQHLGI